MKKEDLKTFMRVEYKDGRRRIVCNNFIINRTSFNELNYYDNDLKNRYNGSLDIVKIYNIPESGADYLNPVVVGKLLWERIDTTEIKKEIKKLEKQSQEITDKLNGLYKKII